MTGWVEARRSTQISTQNLGRDHGLRRTPGAQQGGPLPRHVQGRGRPLAVRRHLQHRGAGAYGRFRSRATCPGRWPRCRQAGSGHARDTDYPGVRAAGPPAPPGRGEHQGRLCGLAAPARDLVLWRVPAGRDRPDSGPQLHHCALGRRTVSEHDPSGQGRPVRDVRHGCGGWLSGLQPVP